ncbi:Cytochrome c heme lyase subunit CcmH [hydrothermal vent metagenome]|uniref:Cytochrome c heme lyase subunit CcmH n=1 Tax=hydrothermal vent metagenome TaxID=652676 RepID=A0A3B0YM08_9ZZZZ
MSTFWLLAGTMAILALAFIALPLLRKRDSSDIDRDQLNTAVVREQLTELKADMEAGKLDADAYTTARHDLERELLDNVSQDKNKHATSSRDGRWILAVVLPAVPLLAIMLYQQLGAGEQSANPPQAQNNAGVSDHEVALMLEKLSQRLNEEPDHPDGWMLLARSYTSLRRYDEAVAAYEQARKYGGNSPELLIDYADTLIAASGGSFVEEAGKMLKQALTLQPDNAKGLWLIGHWFYQRGEYRNAVNSWQRVAPQVQPGSENSLILQQQIQLARARLGESLPAEAETAKASGENKASIQVSVSLDPALLNSAAPDDTVFIFARAVSGPRMPLAIVRKQVRDLPITVTLDDSMAMSPAMVLSRFPQVSVGARISKTGQAMPSPGDLQGMQSPVLTHKTENAIKVVINERVGD